MWLGKSLVGDRPSWHKEPINFFNKMLSIRKVRLLITSRYIAMQSYECVIISTMFLIYFISYGCNDSALVFLGGAEASASPSFALPMFITIKKIIILHLFLGVPAATVGGTGTPWHTRGYAPAVFDGQSPIHFPLFSLALSPLHLCALCAPFIFILVVFPHLPCCFNSFVVIVSSAPSISIYLCPSLFILSISLKFCVSYFRLIATAPGSSVCRICTI